MAAYVLALHHLIAGQTPAAVAVIAVLVFVTIDFPLVIAVRLKYHSLGDAARQAREMGWERA